jgi:hypothetical protein
VKKIFCAAILKTNLKLKIVFFKREAIQPVPFMRPGIDRFNCSKYINKCDKYKTIFLKTGIGYVGKNLYYPFIRLKYETGKGMRPD